MNLRKVFLYLLITSVAVSAVLGIGVILFGEFGEFETKVLLTTLTITCTSILGLACGAYFESKHARTLPVAGIFFAIVSNGLSIFMIWAQDSSNDKLLKTTLTATIFAVACAHLSLISLATLDARFKWSRYTIYTAVAALAAILLWILWLEPESTSDIISRVIGVLSIIIAALTVVTPVFHKLSHSVRTVEQIRDEIEELHARIYRLDEERIRIQNLEDDG